MKEGGVGAVVAASLSVVTEPLVNNMLIKRTPLMEAVKAFDLEMIKKFFKIVFVPGSEDDQDPLFKSGHSDRMDP